MEKTKAYHAALPKNLNSNASSAQAAPVPSSAIQSSIPNTSARNPMRNNRRPMRKRGENFGPIIASGQEQRPLINMPMRAETVKIFALGGLGEYGKNMYVYEQDKDILVVDQGIMFPNESMLGIDFVIPDIRYLEENKERIVGVLLTHGHEDHIGAIPYLYPKLNRPMFATQLTAGMIKIKLEEVGIKNAQISVIKPGDKLKLGSFDVEAIQVAHSIPDSVAYAINTKEGMIIHNGDWKFDHSPISGQRTDIARLAELGKAGVKLLVGESTNTDRPGFTPSESIVSHAFDEIFRNARGRIIVTSFASLINRIQQVINSTVKTNRKLTVAGRSMENNINMAMQLGYLRVPEGTIVDARIINSSSDDKVVVMCTGSQGEEYSALVRMATGEHPTIKIKKGDTVIISASAIPGNESTFYETVDNLSKQGANVIYGHRVDVHVSGHPSQEEHKLMIAITKPEYMLPIHGDYRFLAANAKLARQVGVNEDNIFIAENGQVVEFENGKGRLTNIKIQSGQVLIDGLGVGDVGNIVLRDRQAMAKDGIFVVILTVEKETCRIVTSPDIISRGFIYMRDQEDLVRAARNEIRLLFKSHNEKYPMQWDMVKKMLRDDMSRFLFEKTKRQPMVIPVIIEV